MSEVFWSLKGVLGALCRLILLVLVLVSGQVSFGKEQMMCQEAFAKTIAIQQIEYLRREYAKATDLIGIADDASVAAGRAIYRRIFAQDASFEVSGPETSPLSADGPDGWVQVVLEALGPMGPTQHLIGTQVVEIDSIAFDEVCDVIEGRATMQSYVQAWHDTADEQVWLFIGTYFDQVVFTPGIGWQIKHMELRRVTGEMRPAVAAAS